MYFVFVAKTIRLCRFISLSSRQNALDQSKYGLLNIGLFRKATIFHVAQVFIVFGDFRKGEERKSVAAGQSRNTQIQGFLKMILRGKFESLQF